MLLNKHYSVANRINERLAGANVCITAKPNTPLHTLMEASYQTDAGDIVAHKDAMGINRHDAIQDSIIKLGVETIQGSVYRARNVVRPIVNDIYDEVQRTIEQEAKGMLTYTISQVGLPAVFASSSLASLVEDFSSSTPFDAPIPRDLSPVLTPEELQKYTKMRVASIDEPMTEIHTKNPGLLSELFSDVFRTNEWRWIDDPAAVVTSYVMVRGLLSNITEWDDSGSTGLKNHLMSLVGYFGKKVYLILARNEANFKRGTVLTGCVDKVITVNPETYTKWLSEGGSAEVLIGAVLDGKMNASATELNGKTDTYLKAYNHHQTMVKGSVADAKRTIIGRIVNNHMVRLINETEAFKKNASDYMVRYRKVCTTSVLNTNESYAYILQVVCNTLYENTDAYRILSGIDELTTNDETLDARQAATVVIHAMVTEWLLSMTELKAAGSK